MRSPTVIVEVLTLASVGCELAMAAVFEGVERPGADSAT